MLKTYSFSKPVKSVAFSPDGENIACATDSITIINVKTDQQTKLNYKARKTFDAVTYSPNGAFLAFGGKREYKVYIYEVTYQNEVNKIRAQVNSLSFSPDSRFLYTRITSYNVCYTKLLRFSPAVYKKRLSGLKLNELT